MFETIEKFMVYDPDGVFMGSAPMMEQAVSAAKTMAARDGAPYDVERVLVSDKEAFCRRVRYHPDGTVEQLWKDKEGVS